MTRRRVKTFIRCSFSFNNFKVSRSHIIQLDSLCVTVHPKLLREIPIAMGGQIQINGIIKQEDLCHDFKIAIPTKQLAGWANSAKAVKSY